MLKKTIIIALFALLFVISGCAAKSLKEQDVQGFAPEITENLLIGFNEENYEKFSKDFNDAMLKGIPKDQFSNLLTQIKGKIGNYITGSKKFSTAVLKDNNYTVVYYANFSEETGNVKITIGFQKNGDAYRVSMLYFDSPKLRGK